MRTVVCCASGPSFSEAQAAIISEARRVDLCRVVVVNDNWRRVPMADVLYAADLKWWQRDIEAIRAAGFAGELWTQQKEAADLYGLRHVAMTRGNGLLARGDPRISCGSNSGFQGLMLARLLFAPQRIVLVGYDMQRTGGALHWFGPHAGGLANGEPRTFVQHFAAVAPALAAEGTEVVNCSIASALTCFPRADLAACLPEFEQESTVAND